MTNPFQIINNPMKINPLRRIWRRAYWKEPTKSDFYIKIVSH